MTDVNRLDADEVRRTIERLYLRINERFPGSGLAATCKRLHSISEESSRTIKWILHPNHLFRITMICLILLTAVVLVFSVTQVKVTTQGLNLAEFIQMTEAGLNEIVLITAGIISIVTLDNRRKRKRVISSLNRLRCIAHIIDAQQLTKDPYAAGEHHIATEHSPERKLTAHELERYLDYCSEMLSLTGKMGFLYVQNFDDPVANDAANDLESLTNGFSRNIWQKIMMISMERRSKTSSLT